MDRYSDEKVILKNGQELIYLPPEQRRKEWPRFKRFERVRVIATGRIITILIINVCYNVHRYGSTEINQQYGEPVGYWDFELEPIKTEQAPKWISRSLLFY